MACPNTSRCQLFPLLLKGGFLRVWQIHYCDADFSKCERYKRTQQGKVVAPTLLANGQELAIDPGPKK